MPAKRRSAKARECRITPAALAAWEAGDRLALDRALGLRPWEPSPLDAEGACPWGEGTAAAAAWPAMVELRAELQAASPGTGCNSQPNGDDA